MFAGILRRNFANPEGYSTFAFGDLKKEIPFPTSLVVVSMAAPVVINASVTTTTSRARAFKDPPRTGGDTCRSTTVSSGLGSHKHRHLEPIDLDKEFQIGVRYQTQQRSRTLISCPQSGRHIVNFRNPGRQPARTRIAGPPGH
jgi:hypothetical protein